MQNQRSPYEDMVRAIRRVVADSVPLGGKVGVLSHGDEDLLRLGLREAWHFPQVEDGSYAGFVPADDAHAIAQLEDLRRSGAEFLVFPSTSFWWLDHYPGFRDHLDTKYKCAWADEHCVLIDLGSAPAVQLPGRPPRRLQTLLSRIRENPPPPTSGPVDINVADTRLHERFFAAFPFEKLREFRELPVPDLESFMELPGGENLGYSGWAYWLFYLRGYVEFVESGVVGRGNSYHEFLRRYFVPQARDRGLADELTNPLTAIERIARRFRDLDYYHRPGTHNSAGLYGPAPVKLIMGEVPAEEGVPIYVWHSEAPLLVKRLDGHHRLFAARLFGVNEVRGEVIAEPTELAHVRGAVEAFRFDGKRLEIRGWCVDPRLEIESFEVRHGDIVLAQVGVEGRADVAERFPEVPHAFRSGFAVEQACELPIEKATRFEVIPRSDWLPIGRITVPYLPSMFDAGLSPREALRVAKVVDGMLAPLRRHRPLDSIDAVLVAETTLPLGTYVSQLLPNAELVDGEADLMLAYSLLPGLSEADQASWLRGAHGLLKPGGYLATSVRGELMREFLAGSEPGRMLDANGFAHDGELMYQTKAYTVAECSRLFEVIEYVEGGVDDREDLILLRR